MNEKNVKEKQIIKDQVKRNVDQTHKWVQSIVLSVLIIYVKFQSHGPLDSAIKMIKRAHLCKIFNVPMYMYTNKLVVTEN